MAGRAPRSLGVVLLVLLGGCAVGTDPIASERAKNVGTPDAGAGDLGVVSDAAQDTRDLDTHVPDATVADKAVADVLPADTDVADTADTAVADTAVADTAVADTAVADTAVADTAVADTASTDTGVPDLGMVDAVSCPIRGCAMGTESRSGCADARTIGRTTAATPAGYKITDDLCAASNKFDESGSSCWDANADHAYRLWMQAGESVDLAVTTSTPCSSSVTRWDATLKVIENTGCDDKACTTRTFCAYNAYSHSKTYVAPRDGWYVFVVEGSSAFDDEGTYTFTVKLTCKITGCGC